MVGASVAASVDGAAVVAVSSAFCPQAVMEATMDAASRIAKCFFFIFSPFLSGRQAIAALLLLWRETVEDQLVTLSFDVLAFPQIRFLLKAVIQPQCDPVVDPGQERDGKVP